MASKKDPSPVKPALGDRKMKITLVFNVRGVKQPIGEVQARCTVRTDCGATLDVDAINGTTSLAEILTAVREQYRGLKEIQWLRRIPGI